MDKLLNCPCCGGKTFIRAFKPFGNPNNNTFYEWGCESEFGDCGSFKGVSSTENEAVEKLNRRAPSAAEKELRDCLCDVLAAALIGPELRRRASELLAKK
jgi:hypothetical protein